MLRPCTFVFFAVALLTMQTAPVFSQESSEFSLGDPRIDGSRIQPYKGTWRLIKIQDDGREEELAVFTEELQQISLGGTAAFQRLKQRAYSVANHGKSIGTYKETLVFDTKTLGHLHRSEIDPQGHLTVETWQDGVLWQNSSRTEEPRILDASQRAFHMAMLGLVLKGLPLQEGFVGRLPVGNSGQGFDYWISARVTGSAMVDPGDGKPVDTWVVETEWIHTRNKDWIWPGGDDGSGGTTYILKETPEGAAPFVKNAWRDGEGKHMIIMRDGLGR